MLALRLAAFALANLFTLVAARAILRVTRGGETDMDLLQLLLLRLLLISAMVLAAGLLGELDPISIGIASAAGLLLLSFVGAHRGWKRSALPAARRWVWIVSGAVALRLLLQVWFFAPHLGDAVAYHLPKVAEWVRAAGFTREMGLHPHVTFPAGFELIETWWVVFLRHDALIEMAGVEFVILAAVAVYVLARRVGIGEHGSCVASLIYVLTPGFHLSATSCLNDAPAAAMVLAVAALITGRGSWAAVAMAGALGIGIKPTVAFTFPGLALLAWLVRHEAPPLALGRFKSASLIVAALAVGSFWYVRNIAWFGNPFYPLGATIDNPVAVQLGPRLASLWTNLSDLFGVRITDHVAAPGANVDHGAGWGPVAVSLGLMGLIRGSIQDLRLRRLTLGFCVGLLSTLLFVQNDPWCLKYAFFFPAILSLGAVQFLEARRAAKAILAAGIGLSLVATVLPYDLQFRDFRSLAVQSVETRSALQLWADDVQDDQVGCHGGYRIRSYLLYRPDFSRRVVYIRGGDQAGTEEQLTSRGIRFVYAEDRLSLARSLNNQSVELIGKRLFVCH